jgi:hypothetical protein
MSQSTIDQQIPEADVPSSGGVDVLTMVLTAIMAAVIVTSAAYGFRVQIRNYLTDDRSAEPAFVYIDTNAVLSAQLERALPFNKDNPANASKLNNTFITQYDELISRYVASGYTVLSKEAVVRAKKGLDITGRVIATLVNSDDGSLPVPTVDGAFQ